MLMPTGSIHSSMDVISGLSTGGIRFVMAEIEIVVAKTEFLEIKDLFLIRCHPPENKCCQK